MNKRQKKKDMSKRIYPFRILTVSGEGIWHGVDIVNDAYEVNEEFGRQQLKVFHNLIRRQLGTNNIIMLTGNPENEKEALILEFNVKSTNSTFVTPHFDKRKGMFYMRKGDVRNYE